MDKTKPTLGIYGIQDVTDSPYPNKVHDHGLALFDQGQLLKHLHLERITRQKRDGTLPKHLHTLLKSQGLLGAPYDLVFVDNVIGRAFISAQGSLRFEAPLSEHLGTDLEKGGCYWLDQARDAYVVSHELAHIFSCLPFFGPFKDNSLLIHFDGGASKSNFSAWHWQNGVLRLLESHWDLKYLSSFFNANALNFAILGASLSDQYAVPGKLMGYAAYGQYREEMAQWLVANDYFRDHWKSRQVFFQQARERFGYRHNRLRLEEAFVQDLVATFQEMFTRAVLAKVRSLQADLKADYLYYSGGSALNIVTNSRLVKENLFKGVFIPPCAEDSGLALGAAAFMEYKKHGAIQKCGPYLNNWGIEDYDVRVDQAQIRAVAALLIAEKVIGVCNGFGEIGPRALGNRSIIALANNPQLTQRVSEKCKGREWYRPTAPVILAEDLAFFTGIDADTAADGGRGNGAEAMLSQYMLMDFTISPESRSALAGVVHANGTARIQTLRTRADNPFLYDLLCFMKTQYGVRALINTSFNRQGEPIVHTVADALASAQRMGLDAVVSNGQMQTLPVQSRVEA